MDTPDRLSSEAPFLEEVPEEVFAATRNVLRPDEKILLSVATDLRFDGSYGAAWLVATGSRLIGISPSDSRHPETVSVPLVDIERVEVRELYGSGVLRVSTPASGASLAFFTKSLLSRFTQIPAQIEQLVRQARPVPDDTHIAGSTVEVFAGRKKRCERCQQVIPRWMGVCPMCLDSRKLFFRLLGYAKPYWQMAAGSLLLLLTATFIGLTPPLLMRTLIDDVLVADRSGSTPAASLIPADPRSSVPRSQAPDPAPPGGTDRRTMLGVLVLLLLLVNISRNGLSAVRTFLLAKLGQRITFDLRKEVYRHLHYLSLSFYNERETGRIMSNITQDVSRLQDFISDGLQEIIRDIATIVIICIILFSLNPALAAFVLLPTPLLILFTRYFGRRLHDLYHGLWRRWADIHALLADTIPGVRVVKAFAQEKREVSKFENRSWGLLSGEIRVARVRSIFTPIMTFLTSLGTLIIWWMGGNKVLGGTLSIGEFVAFTGYMWQFYGPVESLCRLNHRFQRAATSAERIFEVLDTQSDVADRPGAVSLPRLSGSVEFSGVTFSYEPGKPILRDLNFRVEPGEMIGLAGHSGAGKSTLINLICRFYDIQKGTIRIDGRDIRDVSLKSLRAQIGVVLQDPFLFNGSVADNIGYGKPGASLDEIVAAAKAANAHDFILDFPEGYDTSVGERGLRVSGGERQRLSIARAILRNPRILILDEATASVDTETEAQIQDAIARLITGRTTFAIAHRLSTLRNANRLLILDKGELAEMGTHDDLIRQDGIYARLCRMQTEMSKMRAW